MAGREAREPVAADGRSLQSESLVHGDRQPETRARRPERVVLRVAEIASVQVIRPHHHTDELEIVDPLRFGDRKLDVGERHEPGGCHARRIVRAVARDPVVVGAARGRRLIRREGRQERNEQPDRRVQHDGVDALRVHGSDVRSGVEAVLELIGHQIEIAAWHERGVGRKVRWERIVGPGREHVGGLHDVRVCVEDAEALDRHLTSSERRARRRAESPRRS